MARKTTAKNQQDVNEMSSADRLWDSLSSSYGNKQDQSDQEYDKAVSQQDRALLQRGMQRSSYGAQSRANLLDKKVQARNDIESEKIADYENRLNALEQQEKEDERWERQFSAQQEQNQWQRDFSERQYADSRDDTAWNRQFSEKQYADTRADAQWNKDFQTQQYQDSRADAQWNKDFSTRQYEDSRADAQWSKDFQAQQYADSRDDVAWQRNFTQQQWEAQQEQWREEFNYNKMSTDQQLAYNYILQAINAGGDVSDDMLAKAGISRADYNAMKKQVSTGSSVPKKNPSPTGGVLDNLLTDETFVKTLNSFDGKTHGTDLASYFLNQLTNGEEKDWLSARNRNTIKDEEENG